MSRFLDADYLMRAFGISRSTAYRVIHELPHVHVGRSIRVSERDLVEALRKSEGKLPTGRGGKGDDQ